MTAIIGIVCAIVSAVCWTAAALIPTPIPLAWLDGPPKCVENRIRAQSWCNGAAAAFAAIAAICQAIIFVGMKASP
jgi:hypothetical protein